MLYKDMHENVVWGRRGRGEGQSQGAPGREPGAQPDLTAALLNFMDIKVDLSLL